MIPSSTSWIDDGYDLDGNAQGSVGVDCGDYDNDGCLDFYLTSYQRQLAALYRNLGEGIFEDVSLASGAAAGTQPNVTWGNGFADFDNDGDRDVFVACGHLLDNVDLFDDTTSYHARNILQSLYGMRLHFGLGKRDRVDRIEVRWIGGGVDVLRNIPADRVLTISQGSDADR